MVDTHKKNQPTKVRLVAISDIILLGNEEFRQLNTTVGQPAITPQDFGDESKLVVFPCTYSDEKYNQFKIANFIIDKAGYKRPCEELYKNILIPGIHEKRSGRKSSIRSFAPAIVVAPDELQTKFPNAEIITIKSLDALTEEYKKSVEHNKRYIEQLKAEDATREPKKRPYIRDLPKKPDSFGRN
ncbi:MAG: hypothetical protein AABY33_01415 [Pseudomonadota bacterium]